MKTGIMVTQAFCKTYVYHLEATHSNKNNMLQRVKIASLIYWLAICLWLKIAKSLCASFDFVYHLHCVRKCR